MKHLKDSQYFFSLTNLEKTKITGGGDRYCCCAWAYAGSGGSSTIDNRDANYEGGSHGLVSPQCNEN